MARAIVITLLVHTLAAFAAPPRAPRVAYEKFRLANGLTVILHEDHRVPTVTVNLWVRVGSRDERPGRTGFAHLFEHMMFMGTRGVPNGELDRMMEAAGGVNNASTTEDRTDYFETGPSNLLETFLFLEADRLSSLADDMTRDKLDLQREVVLNERSQEVDNRPYGKVEPMLPELLFPRGHPYHHPVIGSVADLRAATVADVTDFFHAWYVPSNAQLAIAGDVRSDEARLLVERWFGWMAPAREPLHARASPAPALTTSNEVTIEDRVALPRVTLAFSSPAAFAPGDAECDLLAAVLGMGKSSRLYRELIYRGNVAQSVEVEQHAGRLGGYFVVSALAQAGHGAGEIERALDEELARLGTSPPTAAELSRARAMVETDRLRHLERSQLLAEELNLFEYNFGDPGELERRLLARYEAVRPEDLARIARGIVVARPRVAVRVVPVSPQRSPGDPAR